MFEMRHRGATQTKVFNLTDRLCAPSYLFRKTSNLRLYAKPARLTLRCSIRPRYFTWCLISASSNWPVLHEGESNSNICHPVTYIAACGVYKSTWLLGLVGLEAAYVPGLFSHEDLCQLQQAALKLGRHLQTQHEGHNPQQFTCQIHMARWWHGQTATDRQGEWLVFVSAVTLSHRSLTSLLYIVQPFTA